jgi:hypothetical protein
MSVLIARQPHLPEQEVAIIRSAPRCTRSVRSAGGRHPAEADTAHAGGSSSRSGASGSAPASSGSVLPRATSRSSSCTTRKGPTGTAIRWAAWQRFHAARVSSTWPMPTTRDRARAYLPARRGAAWRTVPVFGPAVRSRLRDGLRRSHPPAHRRGRGRPGAARDHRGCPVVHSRESAPACAGVPVSPAALLLAWQALRGVARKARGSPRHDGGGVARQWRERHDGRWMPGISAQVSHGVDLRQAVRAAQASGG